MAFADLTARLQLNISDFSSKMTQASKQMSAFSNRMNKQYGDAAKSLTAHNMGLKDTTRIVQGIVVAQAFYQGARAIREATSALWGFNEALDYAQITYSALFGSTDIANNFMSVLKEHSIETIFDYQQLADASKKLLAYGIEYKNLMFIMEGLTNLGAMSGDAAALDRISLALGQIYTRGKLTAEEMRQLANAYVPIADIVQERFNLTPDQMGKIGDLNLPAHEVINAVVDYANERFGDVGDAAMYTIIGLKNKIVDTFKVLGVDMLQPVTRAFKSFLVYVANGLENIRNAYAKGGAGGVFEYLVPDEQTQQTVRQFLANVRNLFMSLMSFGAVAGQVMKNFGQVFVTAFNIMTPVIVTFSNLLAKALNMMLSTRAGATILRIALLGAAGAFITLKVHALGALVITAVTKAVMGLSKALLLLATLVTRHPILMLLAGLTAAIVGVSLSSRSANSAIGGLFDTLSAAGGGASSSDILQETNKELQDATNAADQFNNRLEDSGTAAKDLADGIGKAGKAAKKTGDLLSFDEVFRLKDTDSSGSGSGSDVGSIGDAIEGLTGGLGGLSDALIPDIPDFSEFINGFTDGLFGGLKDSIVGNLTLAGLGALLMDKVAKSLSEKIAKHPKLMGAASKFALSVANALKGAFIGLGVDAIISPFTDKLWAFLEESLGLEGAAHDAGIGSTIGSVIGGGIGMLVGGLPGSAIGAAIGHLAGGIVGLLWDEIKGALSNTFTGLGAGIATAISKAWGGSFSEVVKLIDFSSLKGMFSSIGAILKGTGLKAIAKGGVIGMAIGFIVDGIAALLWDWLAEKLELSGKAEGNAKIGGTIGSIIGSIVGGIFFGPAGALIGSAIGTFAGGFVGLLWEKIKDAFSTVPTSLITTIATTIGGIPGLLIASYFTSKHKDEIVKWFDDLTADAVPRIKTWTSETITSFSSWWTETKTGFLDWYTNTKETLGPWLSETKTGFSTWWSDTFGGFSTWWNDTKTGLSTWWNDTVKIFSDWDSINGDTLSDWWENTIKGFSTWWSDTKLGFSTWWTETKTGFSTWYTNTKETLGPWWTETTAGFSTWWKDTKTGFSTWWKDTKIGFSTWASDVTEGIRVWTINTLIKIGTWITDTIQDIKDWAKDVKDAFIQWSTDTVLVIGGFAIAAKEAIKKWCTEQKQAIKDWFTQLLTDIKTWWENSWVYTNWTKAWTLIKGWFSALIADVKLWFVERVIDIKLSWDTLWDTSTWTSAWTHVKTWFTTFLTDIGTWFTNIKTNISTWWSNLWSNLKTPDVGGGSFSVGNFFKAGHATGGIFDREHIARFAEGNKAEAVIPLENSRAMQPFVDAVASGLVGTLAPIMAQGSGNGSNSQLPPLYVGTLIADERGLKELYNRFEVIKVQENARRGLAPT